MIADIVLALIIFYWVLPFLLDAAIALFLFAVYGIFVASEKFRVVPYTKP